MFFANVSIAEKYDYLEEKFRAAYKWLRETDIKSLPEGSYPILGDEVVANIWLAARKCSASASVIR